MGGLTISRDPGVIAAHERDRARRALEARILAMHRRFYAYSSPAPTGAQVDATVKTISTLLRDPDARPMVLAALRIDTEGRPTCPATTVAGELHTD